MSHPKYIGSIQLGLWNQSLKLHKSIKSLIESMVQLHKIDIQSNKILKKNSSRSSKLIIKTLVIPIPPKTLHQTVRGSQPNPTILMKTKIPLQQASNLTTVMDFSQQTLNKPNTIGHKLVAIGQWSNRCSLFPVSFTYITPTHNPNTLFL